MLTLSKTKRPLCVNIGGKNDGTIIYYKEKTTGSNIIKRRNEREILTDTGKFFLIPNTSTRECIGIFGPSGVGKSTWVAEYCKIYKKLFPKNDILLFSNVPKDIALDSIPNIERIPVTEDLISDPLTMEDLKNCLVIFDDVDTISNKELENKMKDMQAQILQTGRHTNTYFLNTVHLGLGGQKTRLILSESTGFVLYPRGGDVHIMRTIMTKYAGLSGKNADEIINDSSTRWIYINKSFPRFVLSENKIYLL